MKKSSIGVTERHHREDSSASVHENQPSSRLSLRLSTVTKDVEWAKAEGGSNAERSMQEQLETYVLATLDPMGPLPRDVALTFRFEDDQTWEIRLKAVSGAKLRRAIMLTLAEKFREIVEARSQEDSSYPIEIALDAKAHTAKAIDIVTAAGTLTPARESSQSPPMVEFEDKTRRHSADDRENPVQAGRGLLEQEKLPGRPLVIAEWLEAFRAELEESKKVIAMKFASRLSALEGWVGTPDENAETAREMTKQAKESGFRFAVVKDGITVPASISYRNRVFNLVGNGGVYVDSSAVWPALVLEQRVLPGRKPG